MTEKQNDTEQINNTSPRRWKDSVSEGKFCAKRNKKERKLRKKRKRLKKIKSLLRFVLFVLLLFAGYQIVMLKGWYLKPTAFSAPDTETVKIINNNIVPSKIVYDNLKDLKTGDVPIFLMRVQPIKKRLFKIPVFKNIFVRRYGFPARIFVMVEERIPAAVLKTDLKSKPVAFVTSDGILVTNRNYMNNAETPSSIKIWIKSPKIDGDWTVKRVEYIEKIVKSVEAYSGEKVEYIDMRNPNDVYVKIETTNVRLGLLDSTVFDRIKRIYTILPQISDVDGNIKYIDLSWDKVNYLKLQKSE